MNSVCISNISGHVVTATKHKGVGSMKDVLIQIKGKRKKSLSIHCRSVQRLQHYLFFFLSLLPKGVKTEEKTSEAKTALQQIVLQRISEGEARQVQLRAAYQTDVVRPAKSSRQNDLLLCKVRLVNLHCSISNYLSPSSFAKHKRGKKKRKVSVFVKEQLKTGPDNHYTQKPYPTLVHHMMIHQNTITF